MSSKNIKVCDICKKEIDIMNELYESMEDNVFGINREWDVCEKCMNEIKLSVKETIDRLMFGGIKC